MHERAGPLGRVHDLVGGPIQNFVVKRFHADANALGGEAGQRKSPLLSNLLGSKNLT